MSSRGLTSVRRTTTAAFVAGLLTLTACGGNGSLADGSAEWDFSQEQSAQAVIDDLEALEGTSGTVRIVLDEQTSFTITADKISPTIAGSGDDAILRGISFSNPGSTEDEADATLAGWAEITGFNYDADGAATYFERRSNSGRGFTVGSTNNTGMIESLALEPIDLMAPGEKTFEYYLLVDDRRQSGAGLTPTLTIWFPLNNGA